MTKVNIRIIAYTPHKVFVGKPSLVTEEEAFEMEEMVKSATVDNIEFYLLDLEDDGETVYIPKEMLKKTIFVIRKK